MQRDLLFAVLVVVATAPSQQTFVVPSARAAALGNTSNPWVFAHTVGSTVVPVHTQLVYDTADVAPATAVLRALSFRAGTVGTGGLLQPGTAQMSVALSVGPLDSAGAVPVFAANQGVVLPVFNGLVQTPQTVPGPGPGVFQVTIPFTTPFPYSRAAGPGLVVDIVTTLYVPRFALSGSFPWSVDAQRVDAGRAELLGSGCPSSTGRSLGILYLPADLYPGSPRGMELGFYDAPPGRVGVGFLSALGSPGSSWLGLRLPYSLAAIGAPACTLDVGATVPFAVQSSTRGYCSWPYPALQLPGDPALNGSTCYAQAFLLDPGANPGGLVMTPSFRLPIRSGRLPRGTTITRVQDTAAAPSGLLERAAVVAQFTY